MPSTTMEKEVQRLLAKAELFKRSVNGHPIDLYTLTNTRETMTATVTNWGGRVVNLIVCDREGQPIDVVLGHDSLQEYFDSEEQYFGAVCGRYANRIAYGRLEIDGTTYSLPINNYPSSLHGGLKGYNNVAWTVEEALPHSLRLSYLSPDGEEGYPGDLRVEMTYTLTDDNTLVIIYEASTSRPTVINLTHHSYFNLNGEGDPSVHNHLLILHADTFLPIDENAIPYGDPAAVEGTPFDFRTPHPIGERIDTPIEQLSRPKGYDHCYVLRPSNERLAPCCECSSARTGIHLSISTTEPGVQLYTGNWMSGLLRGKHGHRYPARAAVCLETQHYPDSPNHPAYPSTLLRPGERWRSESRYAFSTID